MVEKFAGADVRGRGMGAAYRKVSETLGCPFFDAGAVTTVSEIDGVHLEARQHRELGEAITPVVAGLLERTAR
jgi:hypothetical protein